MGWKSFDLTNLTRAPQATFDPAAYLFAQSTRHAVYQGFTPAGGSTGRLYELYWTPDNDRWRVTDLMSSADAPLATANPTAYVHATTGSQHILYVGAPFDGHVHELYWNDDDGWNHHDLTNATRAPLSLGVPCGYEFHADGTQHVVFQGQDLHIHELWWRDDGTGWHHGDLNLVAGAPTADSEPFGYMFDQQGTQHVVYLGKDTHIHELWWKATGGWHHNDLTVAAGAPPAGGAPTGYVFLDQLTQHVNYRGVDGHINELWWQASGWQHANLTQLTGAIPASSGSVPAGYAFEAQPRQPRATQHVLYLGSDGHVHELWWDFTGWHQNDLTAASNSPASISNPAGFVEVDTASQHVYFNSADHHIVELVWRAA
ncbi:MAG: hypothetical protein ABI255_01565 [Microbacteriaceae bacterium]